MKIAHFHLSCSIIMAVFILCGFSGCGYMDDCLKGSGNQVSANREVGQFSRVDVSGSVKIVLKQDSAGSIRVVADDNIIDHVKTYVNGKTLNIDMDRNTCNAGAITVYLSASDYDEVTASGATEVACTGKLSLQDFELHLSGAGKAALNIDAASLLTSSSGASEVVLNGQINRLDIKTSGASDFILKGKTDLLTINTSGASSIKGLDMEADKCHIKSSGNSNISIHVVNELEVHSSGASDVEYTGNPSKIVNDKSGASGIKKIG